MNILIIYDENVQRINFTNKACLMKTAVILDDDFLLIFFYSVSLLNFA
jgi:hypothetical protein